MVEERAAVIEQDWNNVEQLQSRLVVLELAVMQLELEEVKPEPALIESETGWRWFERAVLELKVALIEHGPAVIELGLAVIVPVVSFV